MTATLIDLLLQALQSSSVPGVAIARGDGELIYMNDSLFLQLGTGKHPEQLSEIFPKEVQQRLQDAIAQGGIQRFEYALKESHFECRIVSAQLEGENGITVIALISPIEIEAQALRAIGQVAGKYGHDFNNLLGSIQCSIDMVDHKLQKLHGEEVPVARQIKLIQSAIEKAVRLTSQMRGYARIDPPQYTSVSLESVLSQAVEAVQGMNADLCEFSIVIEDATPVRASEFQLVQAIQSILLNSANAMRSQGERHLLIAVRKLSVEESGEGGAEKMQILCIDHGRGMDMELLNHAFEPFFTTRSAGIGSGLGLGLPMARQIFREHGGEVRISSVKGGGTTVEMLLPSME
jgi:nitrogen fixation/metabolism regulation signal transduction histidine kinase